MIVLLTAPKFDEATEYSNKWALKIREKLIEKNITFIYLGGQEIKRIDFENSTKQCDTIIFYNHGSEDAWYGNKNEKICDLDNVNILKNKYVYTVSCLSAKKLGVEAFKNGSIVFIGYKETFVFSTEEEELFEDSANYGIMLIIEGYDWKEAFIKMKERYNENIRKAKSFWTKTWLAWNRDNLTKYDYEQPPESKCLLRKIAIKLFGTKAWKLTRLLFLGIILFLIGFGIALHDFAHQVWQLKGTVLSLEGGYIGFLLMFLGYLLSIHELLQKL
ncbi:MAG: hypothetical protein NC827_06025 [Candidatus Omnitrophica bacterium]|nr:hypothetical protein [Candidatus Omnitrophota bacterium]